MAEKKGTKQLHIDESTIKTLEVSEAKAGSGDNPPEPSLVSPDRVEWGGPRQGRPNS
jgi:hypothetical protein